MWKTQHGRKLGPVTPALCTAWQARDVVSVSTSGDVVSKRLGLVETWEGLGLDLVSD